MNDIVIPREIQGCLKGIATTKGRRRRPEENDDGHSSLARSGSFIPDEVKISCSKAFRRLGDKTQVASFPLNPHIRNRQSHTLEVSACAVNISGILGLNAELTRAIAFGHDIGHVPFGHQGESYLAARAGKEFSHEVMGVVVAQHIERKGRGLNLSWEVLDGMMRHSGKNATEGMSPEAWVVRYADKIAYLFADFNDFQRMGFPLDDELKQLVQEFGCTQRERVGAVVKELCLESAGKGKVSFCDSRLAAKFEQLRKLMYAVYPRITAQDPRHVLDKIYDFVEKLNFAEPLLVIALMTDHDVAYLSQQSMLNFGHITLTTAGELFSSINGKAIDCCNPDLDW